MQIKQMVPKIVRLSKSLKRTNAYQKRKKRIHCRRRVAIEPIIGHLKAGHRVLKNYLKGSLGGKINFLTVHGRQCFQFQKMDEKYPKRFLGPFEK